MGQVLRARSIRPENGAAAGKGVGMADGAESSKYRAVC